LQSQLTQRQPGPRGAAYGARSGGIGCAIRYLGNQRRSAALAYGALQFSPQPRISPFRKENQES
jgi:hypothetical protein